MKSEARDMLDQNNVWSAHSFRDCRDFARGVGNKSKAADVKFYSAKTPTFYQISRHEQVLDILRNVTTNPPDRVREFSFKASGGRYAKLFDGTEKVLSRDKIVWLNRSALLP